MQNVEEMTKFGKKSGNPHAFPNYIGVVSQTNAERREALKEPFDNRDPAAWPRSLWTWPQSGPDAMIKPTFWYRLWTKQRLENAGSENELVALEVP